jgi:hypothetical protein
MVPSFKVAPTNAVFSSIAHCPIVPLFVMTSSELCDTSSFLFLGTALAWSITAPYTPTILPGGSNIIAIEIHIWHFIRYDEYNKRTSYRKRNFTGYIRAEERYVGQGLENCHRHHCHSVPSVSLNSSLIPIQEHPRRIAYIDNN